ncbi:MAG: heat-inducible transcription repressor HrcA [Ruminococcaceae bacterium]|nr:heat-inducible transcription repressor HrcA [Oscillospiraceae bacterium]
MFGDELSERKRAILNAIVEAHIEGGDPVGSKFLVQNKQIACSSATIRNEMAELTELGYLEQPHTSAGRVPSELAYRFYVDQLARSYAVTTHEIDEINRLLKVKMTEIDQILSMASKVASVLTNYTGIAVKQKSAQISIKRFEGFVADEENFVLVMMTSAGTIKTKYVRVDTGISPTTVNQLTSVLNANISGLTADDITLPIIMNLESRMGNDAPLIGPIIKCIYEVLHELDSGELKYSGVDRLLQYPEYSDTDQLRTLIGSLERKDEIMELMSGATDDEINVILGSESPVQVMNNSAMVFKPIVKGGKKIGAVGVIGPLRMDYAKVLSTIAGITGRLADMLDDNSLTEGEDTNGRKE